MIVATAVLAGCAIGPDYKRPTVAEPPVFRGQETAEAVSFADAPWWEVFQDPILKELIEEALRRNYDVAIAAARVQEARANVGCITQEVSRCGMGTCPHPETSLRSASARKRTPWRQHARPH